MLHSTADSDNRQLAANWVYCVVYDSLIQNDLTEGKLMRETLDAVFENGAFRPLSPAKVPLSQGQRVKLIIETPLHESVDLIALAAKVYEGLTDEQIDEIERLALDRSNFFGDQTTDEPARSSR